MRSKPVPEKKRSMLGSFFGSGKKAVASAKKKVPSHEVIDTPNVKQMITGDDVEKPAKKSRRYKPGTVALREIKKAQSNHGLSGVSVSRMDRIIREIASDITMTSKGHGDPMRFQPKALQALKEAAEQFETDVLRLGNTLSIHRGKMTLHKKDLCLASTLMLAPHVQQERNGSSRLLAGVLNIMRRTGPAKIGNDQKAIEGRSGGTLIEKTKNLRKFTQETAYDPVADPPGLVEEEAGAQAAAEVEALEGASDQEDMDSDDDADEDEDGTTPDV
jgi:histone H3-like centromeric protein A